MCFFVALAYGNSIPNVSLAPITIGCLIRLWLWLCESKKVSELGEREISPSLSLSLQTPFSKLNCLIARGCELGRLVAVNISSMASEGSS